MDFKFAVNTFLPSWNKTEAWVIIRVTCEYYYLMVEALDFI